MSIIDIEQLKLEAFLEAKEELRKEYANSPDKLKKLETINFDSCA